MSINALVGLSIVISIVIAWRTCIQPVARLVYLTRKATQVYFLQQDIKEWNLQEPSCTPEYRHCKEEIEKLEAKRDAIMTELEEAGFEIPTDLYS